MGRRVLASSAGCRPPSQTPGNRNSGLARDTVDFKMIGNRGPCTAVHHTLKSNCLTTNYKAARAIAIDTYVYINLLYSVDSFNIYIFIVVVLIVL